MLIPGSIYTFSQFYTLPDGQLLDTALFRAVTRGERNAPVLPVQVGTLG